MYFLFISLVIVSGLKTSLFVNSFCSACSGASTVSLCNSTSTILLILSLSERGFGGCEERKQKLNELFPYNKPECLLEDEYEFLTWWYSETRNQMRPSEQLRILEIYNRTFHKNMQPTSCGSCLRDVLQKLKTLTDEYGK